MKKLSLKNAKNILSRKEMKAISGGYYGTAPGYFYDGKDCWIAGTWVTGDNGERLFIPGSAATQYLNNICGWGNVA
ncbi:hypothetical protein [Flavobacterium daejeonense]|uniref:hypothetical protein n=1 Tax=Flavobacterium daejeonense TaxID=350893 RepID=UPI00047AE9DE|nr:hypothetical protein [Flavobacterium daejeonense]